MCLNDCLNVYCRSYVAIFYVYHTTILQGVIMKIQEERLVRGGVLCALADTLAAHSLGGFKVGVGLSLRVCRMCLATREQAAVKVNCQFGVKLQWALYC